MQSELGFGYDRKKYQNSCYKRICVCIEVRTCFALVRLSKLSVWYRKRNE